MGLVLRPVVPDASPATAGTAVADADLAPLRCDVSLLSDDSTPADDLVSAEAERVEALQLKRLLRDAYARLRAEYDGSDGGADGFIPHPACIRQHVRRAALACAIEPTADELQFLLGFFDRVNRALFVQQTLGWLADAGGAFKVHVYGAGWDRHPAFASMHRGAIDEEAMRRAVWRASRINLAAGGPYGAVDVNAIDGISAGGFFLMRFCPGDVIERTFAPVYEFCRANGVTVNQAFRDAAPPPGVIRVIELAGRAVGVDLLADWPDFIPHVLSAGASGMTRGAWSLWSDYASVNFATRDELLGLVSKYLYDGPERLRIAESMRRELAVGAHRIRVSVNRRLVSDRAPREGEVAA